MEIVTFRKLRSSHSHNALELLVIVSCHRFHDAQNKHSFNMSTRKLTIAEAEYQGLTVKGLGAATTDVLIILLPMQSRVYSRPCMSQSFLWKSHGNCQCQHGHVICAYVGLRAWVHVIRHVKGQSNASCSDSSSPCMKFPCTKHESSADEQSSKR